MGKVKEIDTFHKSIVQIICYQVFWFSYCQITTKHSSLFNSNFEKNTAAQNSKLSDERETKNDNNNVLLKWRYDRPTRLSLLVAFPDLLQYEISWNKAPGIEKQSEIALKICVSVLLSY